MGWVSEGNMTRLEKAADERKLAEARARAIAQEAKEDLDFIENLPFSALHQRMEQIHTKTSSVVVHANSLNNLRKEINRFESIVKRKFAYLKDHPALSLSDDKEENASSQAVSALLASLIFDYENIKNAKIILFNAPRDTRELTEAEFNATIRRANNNFDFFRLSDLKNGIPDILIIQILDQFAMKDLLNLRIENKHLTKLIDNIPIKSPYINVNGAIINISRLKAMKGERNFQFTIGMLIEAQNRTDELCSQTPWPADVHARQVQIAAGLLEPGPEDMPEPSRCLVM